MLGVDSSATLIRLARDGDPEGNYRVGGAAALPMGDGEATTVVIFMALHINPHRVEQPLYDARVTHHHRPLGAYFAALTDARFVVEAMRELPTRRRAAGRIPAFLHLRAVAR